MIVSISAAMIMFLALGAKLPASTLSQELEPGLDFCPIFEEPWLILCEGTCKPRCGRDEILGHGYCGRRCECCKLDVCPIFEEPRLILCGGGGASCKPLCDRDETGGWGYCGRRCDCCKPKIINTCHGKCRTDMGYGYCKENCGYGEERLGGCKRGSCSCCRDRPTCTLPKVVGPCEALVPSYYHDVDKGQCIFFNYGGCGGNANRFDTYEQCRITCEPTCTLPKVVGPCEALVPSYYHDVDKGQCIFFNYGGCGGNANRFDTYEQCRITCEPINKPGGCPVLPAPPPPPSPLVTLEPESGCQGDMECPGAQKCCALGVCCSNYCMSPCDPTQPWCLG